MVHVRWGHYAGALCQSDMVCKCRRNNVSPRRHLGAALQADTAMLEPQEQPVDRGVLMSH